jgi:lactoylglutathione lyase
VTLVHSHPHTRSLPGIRRPPTLSTGPQPRTLSTGPQPRTLSTGPQPRTLSTGPQPRTLSTGPQPRTLSTGRQPRTLSTGPQPRTLSTGPQARTLHRPAARPVLATSVFCKTGEDAGGIIRTVTTNQPTPQPNVEPRPKVSLSLGWVIAYVDDPAATSAFYQQTFGLRGEFTSPEGSYAQLDTGATKLAFASYALGEKNFPGGVRRAGLDGLPPNVEITLVTDDVDAAVARAVDAGCARLAAAEDKPHGQRVAFVRDPFGTLVEIATPM